MPGITVFSAIIMLPLIIILLIRRFGPRKKNISSELFAEALRNENSGQYETALVTYERALNEVKKTRFQGSSLRSKIVDKLKVLHTVIEYKNGFHFGR